MRHFLLTTFLGKRKMGKDARTRDSVWAIFQSLVDTEFCVFAYQREQFFFIRRYADTQMTKPHAPRTHHLVPVRTTQ
jgi:hypothetical protein